MSSSIDQGLLNDINPMAYTVATNNNHSSLTQKMLSNKDHEHFVAAQCPKIDGLQNANVFNTFSSNNTQIFQMAHTF